jgi:hypothetical protein
MAGIDRGICSILQRLNQIRKQHAVAIDLLTKFNLDHVRLERQPGGYCVYYGWSTPLPAHNGAKTIKRGRIRVPA